MIACSQSSGALVRQPMLSRCRDSLRSPSRADAIHSAQYAAHVRNSGAWKLWAAAALSAGLLELPFPLAGPLPPWRSVFAWFGLVPLLWASVARLRRDRAAARCAAPFCSPISAACCGTWATATGFATPCCATATCRRLLRRCCCWATAWCWGSTSVSSVWASCWCARPPAARGWRWPPRPSCGPRLELAAARITSVPWDQLGYSQVDNAWSISSRPGPASTASVLCWLPSMRCSPAAC